MFDELFNSNPIARMFQEYDKLCHDPCMKIPKVGDRIVYAVGCLGIGSPFAREEAEVIEKGDQSYKIRITIKGQTLDMWISSVLVTDVLDAPAE